MDLLLCTSYYLKYELLQGARAQPYPSLGVLYLASYLRDRWQLGVFDATFSDGESAFEEQLEKLKPRVVGIQALITTRHSAHCMIRIAKQKGSVVVVGGPDPSVCYEQYLRWGADFVVIGEGEATMYELMAYLSESSNSKPLTEIPGLAYWDGSEIKHTKPRKAISDLDEIPWPAYDLVDVERYLDVWRTCNGYSSMHIATSRGCPFNCQWCSHAVFGRSFHQRSVENVISEMLFLKEHYDPEHLTIADDTFALNKEWLYRWCGEIQRQGIDIHFRCFSRADVVNPEVLHRLKAAGCCHIHLGVESGSQRVLDWMHKGTTIQDICRASRQIKEAGIGLGYFIMFAYPGETRVDIRKTEKLIRECKPDSLGLSIAHPVPGTPFYDLVSGRLIDEAETNDDMEYGNRLRFRATYPEAYYQRLIRYVDRQHVLNHSVQPITNRVIKVLENIVDFIILRGIEWFFPTFNRQSQPEA